MRLPDHMQERFPMTFAYLFWYDVTDGNPPLVVWDFGATYYFNDAVPIENIVRVYDHAFV